MLIISYYLFVGLLCLFCVPVKKQRLRANFGCVHEKYPVKPVSSKMFEGVRCPNAMERRSLLRRSYLLHCSSLGPRWHVCETGNVRSTLSARLCSRSGSWFQVGAFSWLEGWQNNNFPGYTGKTVCQATDLSCLPSSRQHWGSLKYRNTPRVLNGLQQTCPNEAKLKICSKLMRMFLLVAIIRTLPLMAPFNYCY